MEKGFRAWLVTCKHVVQDKKTKTIRKIRVSLNRHTVSQSQPFEIKEDQWTLHPTADIAVVQVAPRSLENVGADWSVWAWEKIAIGKAGAKRRGLHEGDEVLSLGFPIGFDVGKSKAPLSLNFPLVRAGVLAQISGWLQNEQSTFLVDCPIFDGNSGGPICTVPSLVAIRGSQLQDKMCLIGVATKKISAKVAGTGHTPLDLGVVTPIDFVNEAIEAAMAKET